MPRSLNQFAVDKGLQRSTTCLVCLAPDEVREQIEANERLPKKFRIVRKDVVVWAREEYKADISTDSIYKHIVNHV